MSVPRLKQSFDIDFKYYDDNKTIVCYLTPQRSLDYLTVSTWFAEDTLGYIYEDNMNKRQFKGVARFKSTDDFNLQMGKEIAKKKAMRSYYRYLRKEAGKVMNQLKAAIDNRINYLSQAEDKIAALTQEIKDLE